MSYFAVVENSLFKGGGGGGRSRWAQSKVRAYTMLVPIGENVTLFSDFSLEPFSLTWLLKSYPFF